MLTLCWSAGVRVASPIWATASSQTSVRDFQRGDLAASLGLLFQRKARSEELNLACLYSTESYVNGTGRVSPRPRMFCTGP